ncbi:hypothetical protein [Pseudomonas sp. PDM09]|uniref:hypothetical protein n=1 Tax=Pseudomonas sp. PDM09 TaxID=2769270 RepID=UPI00177B8973|nr:hypothetical protein [Pseudomonas sp. PDM09]MBD9565280.1 hypothetical protein [Pseudomonas sp. PDM09]
MSEIEQAKAHREDGSGAQDRRHEESGQYRREQVSEAAEAVAQQRNLIASLK